MPTFSHGSGGNNWILPLKVVFVSISVVSMAVMLKLSAPVVANLAVSEVPNLWNVVVTWLRPPYLYFVMNFIIFTIVASTKLQSKSGAYSPPTVQIQTAPIPFRTEEYAAAEVGFVWKTETVEMMTPEVFEYGGYKAAKVEQVSGASEHADVDTMCSGQTETSLAANPKSSPALMKTDTVVEYRDSTAKPPVSARFSHRKVVKANPEVGKILGVSKPKRHETLESTWKMITEGRPMPLTRHLRKSDTWETDGPQHNSPLETSGHDPHKMSKSDTFIGDRATAEATNNNNYNSCSETPSRAPPRLKKEPSPGQEELNRRVEAFIRKFNEDMRLQRQESLNQYMEMMNHCTH